MAQPCDINNQGRYPDLPKYKNVQWYSNGILTDTSGGNIYGTPNDHPQCSNIQNYGIKSINGLVGYMCTDSNTCPTDDITVHYAQDTYNNDTYTGLVCIKDNKPVDCCGNNALGLIVANETDISATNNLGHFLCKYPPPGYKFECTEQSGIYGCNLTTTGTFDTQAECESNPSCPVKSYNLIPGDGKKLGPYCKEYHDTSTGNYPTLAECESHIDQHSCPHVTGYNNTPVQDCTGGLNYGQYINRYDTCKMADTSYNACSKLKPGRGQFKFKEYCANSQGPPTHTVCECNDSTCVNKCTKKGDNQLGTSAASCCSGKSRAVPFVGVVCD